MIKIKKPSKQAKAWGGIVILLWVQVLQSPKSNTNSYKSASNQEHPWPQQDDTLQQAIQNGYRIDVDQTPTIDGIHYMWNGTTTCETPRKGLATVVTAYYDLKSKHPREQYEAWINLMVTATDPMVIFVDPTSAYFNWWPIMKQKRQHAPTLLVSLPFQNLTMSKVFSDDFWYTYIFPRDRTGRYLKGVDVYKIWNEKTVMMREVAKMNPFQTDHFYWIDAGYYRRKVFSPNYTPIVRNNITDNGVNRHQIVYQVVQDFPTYEIAGGAWGGTKDAIYLHYQRYWETFWYLTMYSDKECVGFEQRVQVWMCRSFPKICVLNKFRGRGTYWFSMGRDWLRDPDFDFMSHPFQIPVDNTTTVPPVDPSILTFPNERVIGFLNEIPKGSLSLEHKMNYTHVLLPEDYG